MKALFAALMTSSLLAALPLQAETSKGEAETQLMEITLRGAGKMRVGAFLAEDKGKAVVCGVYLVPDGESSGLRSRAKVIMKNIYFTLDNRPMTLDATTFRRFDSAAELDATADLEKVTGVASQRPMKDVRDLSTFKMWLKPDAIAE